MKTGLERRGTSERLERLHILLGNADVAFSHGAEGAEKEALEAFRDALDLDTIRALLRPAPAPLPGEAEASLKYVKDALHFEADRTLSEDTFLAAVQTRMMRFAKHFRVLLRHITDLTRRLAEAEECLTIAHMDGYHKGQKAGQSEHNNSVQMGKYILDAKTEKRLREAAEGRVRELEVELAGLKDENEHHEKEREAGWQLAGDAARGLRVECDGDLGHEAEQIRAERDALWVALRLILKCPGATCPGSGGLCPEHAPEPGCILTRDVAACWVAAARSGKRARS